MEQKKVPGYGVIRTIHKDGTQTWREVTIGDILEEMISGKRFPRVWYPKGSNHPQANENNTY